MRRISWKRIIAIAGIVTLMFSNLSDVVTVFADETVQAAQAAATAQEAKVEAQQEAQPVQVAQTSNDQQSDDQNGGDSGGTAEKAVETGSDQSGDTSGTASSVAADESDAASSGTSVKEDGSDAATSGTSGKEDAAEEASSTDAAAEASTTEAADTSESSSSDKSAVTEKPEESATGKTTLTEVDNTVAVKGTCKVDDETIKGHESFAIKVTGTTDPSSFAPSIDGYTFTGEVSLGDDKVSKLRKETTEETTTSERTVTNGADDTVSESVDVAAGTDDNSGSADQNTETATPATAQSSENENAATASSSESSASSSTTVTDTNITKTTFISYSTDGESYTKLTSDTTLVFHYTKDEVAEKTIALYGKCVDTDDAVIKGYGKKSLTVEDTLDLTKAPFEIDGYTYKEAKIDDVVVTAIDKKTSDPADDSSKDSGSKDATSDSSHSTVTYSYISDGKTTELTDDTTITFVYEAEEAPAIKLTATYVDEYGDAIDDDHTDVELTGFAKNVLTISAGEDAALPEKIQVEKGSNKKLVIYDYEKTYVKIDGRKTRITSIKREKKDDGYSYSVKIDGDSEYTDLTEDGTVYFAYNAGSKTWYTYEDSKVKVTARLQHANAIPDDARFQVTPVTKKSSDYNYNAYMAALNDNADKLGADSSSTGKTSDSADAFNEDNTLLYDIAFMGHPVNEDGTVDESKTIEFQPAEGNVKISIEFKKNQLSEDLGATSSEDIQVVHLPLKDSVEADTTSDAKTITSDDISIDMVEASVNSDNAEFKLSNFSVTAFYNNTFNDEDWKKDWVRTTDGKYYYFTNTLSDDDITSIGGKDKIKLEYHYIDSDEETFINSKYYNSSCTLGIAGNFHIVAFGTATLGAHTNGNVLCKNLAASSNFGTNNYDEVSYVSGNYNTVSSASGSKNTNPLALGNGIEIGFEDNGNSFSIINSGRATKLDKPTVIYRDSDSINYIDLESVKSEISNISTELAAKQAGGVTEATKSNTRTYTLNNPDSVGVINLTADEVASMPADVHFSGFNSGHDGSIIVNVNCGGKNVTLPERAYIYVDGEQQSTNEVTSFGNGKIIWNFTNCSQKTITAKNMTGTIIALGASVELTQNINGTIIAENTHNSAETHRTDFTGKTSGDSTTFGVKKAFKDDRWPDSGDYRFEFCAIDKDGSTPIPDTSELVLSKNKTSGSFGDISYPYVEEQNNKTVDYYYSISEEAGINDDAVTYDKTVYYLKVSVKYATDSATGNHTATITGTWYNTTGFDKTNDYKSFDRNTFVFDFTNSFTEKTSISGTKTWSDNNDAAGLRPDTITVQLYAGGTAVEGKTTTAKATDNWAWSFKGLDKYDTNGTEIEYSAKESSVPAGYDSSVIKNEDGSFTIKNTIQTTDLTAIKDFRGDNLLSSTNEVDLQLYADGVAVDNGLRVLRTSSEKDSLGYYHWQSSELNAEWKEIPKYSNGVEISYSVRETNNLNSFIVFYNGNEATASDDGASFIGGTARITNCELTSVSVTKSWNDSNNQDNIRPSSVTAMLYADGVYKYSAELNADNSWSHTWSGLELMNVDGHAISYTVQEFAVPVGYTASVSGSAADGYVITNTHTPGTPDTPSTPDTPTTPDTPDSPSTVVTTKTPQLGATVQPVSVVAPSTVVSGARAAATGDDSSMQTYGVISGTAMAGLLAWILVFLKKKKRKQGRG